MSTGPYVPPVISVSFDPEAGYVLMCSSHGRTSTAGVRLFRAEPHPAVMFTHETEEGAERDAEILRSYLDECASGKRKEKEVAPVGRGWWQD